MNIMKKTLSCFLAALIFCAAPLCSCKAQAADISSLTSVVCTVEDNEEDSALYETDTEKIEEEPEYINPVEGNQIKLLFLDFLSVLKAAFTFLINFLSSKLN